MKIKKMIKNLFLATLTVACAMWFVIAREMGDHLVAWLCLGWVVLFMSVNVFWTPKKKPHRGNCGTKQKTHVYNTIDFSLTQLR